MTRDPIPYDGFAPGDAFHEGPRTLSREDIDAFTALSGDRTALHTDDAYAATTPLGGVVAHGVLNLAAATGLAYDMGIFRGTVLALRSMEVSYDRPVRPGDAVTLHLTVADLDARPRPDRGRVTFEVSLTNQDGKTVLSGRWQILVRREAPASA